MIVVLDTAGLDTLLPTTIRGRARLDELRAASTDIVVPAVVLAEGVMSGRREHDYHMTRLLQSVSIEPVGEETARLAGDIRQSVLRQTRTTPSAVDAIVAVCALERSALHDEVLLLTSDKVDIESLLVAGGAPANVSMLRV